MFFIVLATQVYDHRTGGLGASTALYQSGHDLLARAAQLVASCPCGYAAGCPCCSLCAT